MSYPGYPGYPQAGPGMPQPNPYQATSQPGYPPYPGSAGGQPAYPSQPTPYPGGGGSGFPPGPPSSFMPMPQSSSPYPATPQVSQPYPSTPQVSQPYPAASQPYPSAYPSSTGSSAYPPATGTSAYPPSTGTSAYPPSTGTSAYPPSTGTSAYPPSTGTSAYPPPTGSSAYPPTGSYPPQSAGSHPSQPGYPPAQHQGYPSQPPAGQHSIYPTSSPHHDRPPSPDLYVQKVSHSYSAAPSVPHGGHQQAAYHKGNPTVRPEPAFNARQDAEVLRKAMKGFGTDEKALISVICRRSNVQRQEIAMQFKTLYGKDLIKDIKSEISGRFEDLIVGLMTPLAQFYAREVHDAISGLGTDEACLIEVFCTLNNHEIHTVRAAYETMYRNSLESDLTSDTSGHFKRLMRSLCMGNRDESYAVDPGAAQQDAQALLRAGELRVGTDESVFNAILCSRSYTQLRQIFMDYERLTGHSITKAIKKEFSGDIESGLLALVKSVINKADFFAERLHDSMAGMGTKDRTLIRIMVTRCEVDMADIKQAFSSKYGKTLESFIEGDCSGDYKRALLALLQ